MNLLKKISCYAITLFIANISLNTYALDQMAKEETTPPIPENALKTEHIPPLFSTNKEKTEETLNKEPSSSLPSADDKAID